MAGPSKPFAFVAPLVLAALSVALVTLVFARRSETVAQDNPLDPTSARIRALVELADASTLLGNSSAARRALEQASALAPDDPIVRSRLEAARMQESRDLAAR
ncbi:MAG: hypothetical protein HUU15_17010, partial [Candidatus Brocadiae bacterium]|nr:hypothetical protein [Candidatus Brocadiia bacterium]